MIQTLRMLSTAVNATGPSLFSIISGGVFQASVTFTGLVTAVVSIQASLDGVNWHTLGTINLSDSAPTGAVFSTVPWPIYRSVVSGIGGTGVVTNIIVNMGVDS